MSKRKPPPKRRPTKAEAENARLKKLVDSLSDKLAICSEQLARYAEKPDDIKKRGPEPTLDPVLIASLLAKYNGNIAAVAREVSKGRDTVHRLIQNNETLQTVLANTREGMLDNAESSLTAQVLKGNLTAIIFFLKTQGRKRGYVERQQIEHGEIGATEVEEEVIATRTNESENPTDAAPGPVPG